MYYYCYFNFIMINYLNYYYRYCYSHILFIVTTVINFNQNWFSNLASISVDVININCHSKNFMNLNY